jgi:hypothetical protein
MKKVLAFQWNMSQNALLVFVQSCVTVSVTAQGDPDYVAIVQNAVTLIFYLKDVVLVGPAE